MGAGGGLFACLVACLLSCPLVQVVGVQDLTERWFWSSCRVFRPFAPLLLCSRCVAIEICLYSHFKAVFGGFWGACVGLFVLGALRGLCGFCVRERLGGFGACGVFAFLFVLLLVLFSPCAALLWLPFACPLALSWLSCFGFVVAFSLSDVQTKRKGAKCLPCVLSCPVVVC